MAGDYTLLVRPRGGAGEDALVRDASDLLGAELRKAPGWGGGFEARVESGRITLSPREDASATVDHGPFPWQLCHDEPGDPRWAEIAREQMFDLYRALAATARYECVLLYARTDVVASTLD